MTNQRSITNIFIDAKAILGEGPIWINSSQELLWVDISKGEVHATNITTKKDKIIYQGDKASAIIPISDKEFLISDTNKLILVNTATGAANEYTSILFETKNIRFNDGKADPNGNLWIGTMEMDIKPNKGALYRVDSNKEMKKCVSKVTISNGITWSLDKKTMYYIDTVKQGVYAFNFDENSNISNQRMVITIPLELGAPDGMTIDNQGNLWIALWGGACVTCWNPKSGQLLKKINVDAPLVTSCTFGGKNMNTLFITTAKEGLSASDLEKYPNSGSIFTIKTEVNGFKPNYYTPLH
ncbi:SMP-30/gluconolactonase/LRE family protein [Snuella sedimenti]|uniref:SMP-30/gluconolactonase/LRE family protein n=1 Tax=Snuella sedimenti TaxID=2798802 RepID=A0A8J7LSB9_9FLAO|nr:SMP-30/gluconolactonase/LRE family protein [Snuella sedimenti]MBJ6367191.1 SMP-30/gluconolactonase/LRE family protein [Snuella sedimenti]